MRGLALLILLLSSVPLFAGDTLYARQVVRKLTSKKCYGRGYLRNGLAHAEKYIVSEIRKTGAAPGFNGRYTDGFVHPVNTFPASCLLRINGKEYRAGYDYIPDPASAGLTGKFRMKQVDSVTYKDEENRLRLLLKKKLTFSVAGEVEPATTIELDRSKAPERIEDVEIALKNRFEESFRSRNISCVLQGKEGNDSMLVFTAHYDHLGGIGKKTWFPGANDNASGVSMLLNLLRHYQANPPRYRTVFLFFAGEEAGLVGSRHYVSHPTVDLSKIRFLINLDLLGTGDDGIMVVNGAVHEKEFAVLQAINSEGGLVKEIRKRGKAANSDHYWFTEAGVPAFFIYTMGGRTAYHNVYDTEKGLPFTDYPDVFTLITRFADSL